MNAYAELVRLPAVLSVPGDPLLGSATAPSIAGRRTGAAVASSALAYMAGMALNDFADRHVDAVERPHRPIPSGRISGNQALAVGVGLLAADLAVAWTGSGRRAALYSMATGTAVLTYDFAAKNTPAGPGVMAVCRFLDVQRGSHSFRAGLWPASLVAAHTYVITRVSRDEVEGADPGVGQASAAATAAIALATLITAVRSARRTSTAASAAWPPGTASGTAAGSALGAATRTTTATRTASAVLVGLATGLYAVPSIRASLAAARDPSPGKVQRIVGTGVMGMIPLQSALSAAAGRPGTSAGLLAMWRVGRVLARRRRVT